MRIIDMETELEVTDPDLENGYLTEPVMFAPKEAYATIDNVTKFGLADEDFEEVRLYHRYTAEELAQQAESASQAERDAILSLIIDSVEVDAKPADKLGFDTVRRYDHGTNRVFWEFVPNGESAEDGSYLHPFAYTQGMSVQQGMWYTDGENIWEAIADGVPSGFDDAAFSDIIAI